MEITLKHDFEDPDILLDCLQDEDSELLTSEIPTKDYVIENEETEESDINFGDVVYIKVLSS